MQEKCLFGKYIIVFIYKPYTVLPIFDKAIFVTLLFFENKLKVWFVLSDLFRNKYSKINIPKYMYMCINCCIHICGFVTDSSTWVFFNKANLTMAMTIRLTSYPISSCSYEIGYGQDEVPWSLSFNEGLRSIKV